MKQLNLPTYSFKIKTENNKEFIFDNIRKRFVSLTPEEWVRQNFIQYLIKEKKYSASLIAVEVQLKYNLQDKRGDILIYNKLGKPFVIVECKAPEIKITEKVFEQIARYNMNLKVEYLIVTNGLQHYYCEMDYKNNSYKFLEEIPKNIGLSQRAVF